MSKGSWKKHTIRSMKTCTGKIFFVTVSKDTATRFSGCALFETVTNNLIILSAGSKADVKDVEAHKKYYGEVV